jgi:hypothetical protein
MHECDACVLLLDGLDWMLHLCPLPYLLLISMYLCISPICFSSSVDMYRFRVCFPAYLNWCLISYVGTHKDSALQNRILSVTSFF